MIFLKVFLGIFNFGLSVAFAHQLNTLPCVIALGPEIPYAPLDVVSGPQFTLGHDWFGVNKDSLFVLRTLSDSSVLVDPHTQQVSFDPENLREIGLIEKGRGSLRFVELLAVAEEEPLLAFSAHDGDSRQFVVLNFETLERRVLGDILSPHSPTMRFTRNGRYFLLGERTGPDESVVRIFDLVNNRSLSVQVPLGASYQVSEGGDRLLVSRKDYDERRRMHTHTQFVATELAGWQDGYAHHTVLPWKALASIEIAGKLVSVDGNLRTFVIDRSHGDASFSYRRVNGYPHIHPDLRLVHVGKGVRTRRLGGWSRVSEKIEEAVGRGLFMKYDSLKSVFSPDGESFFLHFDFSSAVGTFSRNWVGVWNVKGADLIVSADSSDLDTRDDREVSRREESMIWRRQFRAKWNMAGQVVLTRALVHEAGVRSAQLILKVMLLTTSGDFSLQGFTSGIFNPDPDGIRKELIGVSQLGITPRGDFVLVNIAGIGVRAARLRSSSPRPTETSFLVQ